MIAAAGITLGYGALMTFAASAAYWSQAMRRGAFATMTLGGVLLSLGALLHAGELRAGLWLAAAGLYLISDAAYAVGSRRAEGPRWSHHVVRAMIAVVLLGLLWWTG